MPGATVCASYWSQSGSLLAKDIKISQLQSQEFPDYAVQKFIFTRADHPDERVANHFQFFSLLDRRVPKDSSVFLSFINKINKWRRVNVPKVSYSLFLSDISCTVIFFEQI